MYNQVPKYQDYGLIARITAIQKHIDLKRIYSFIKLCAPNQY